jgi:hypothetical protein
MIAAFSIARTSHVELWKAALRARTPKRFAPNVDSSVCVSSNERRRSPAPIVIGGQYDRY